MDYVVEEFGKVTVIIINLDRATLKDAPGFKSIIEDKIKQGKNSFIVDLTNCEFIDSTFLGVLVGSLKKVVKLKGDLKLVGFKPAVKSMFELTRLFRVFESYTDLEKAIESF